MGIIYYYTVVMICIKVGNSLESTRNQSPSKERFNFFDAELLQVFNEDSGNVLVSPISIKLVLGMLMEGAEGDTVEEIRTALRLPYDEEATRKEFQTWLSMLQVNESANVLKIANRVFLSNHYTVGPDYGKTLKKYYSGGVASVKFEDPKEVSRTINDWVGNQTSQLIPSIVEEGQIQANHKLMLTSAVYFKGLWSQPFASERSAMRCFYSRDNKCKESLMMAETGYFNYGYISKLDAKAVVLPFKGGQFSMLLLLPSRKEGIELLSRDLLHVSLSSILSETKEQEVFVQIPQFEISYNKDLVESLKKMHISQAFGHDANLSKMFENHLESVSVSKIFHSTKITVNEEGTEAAAATGALFVPLMGGTTTSFVANRPFLFFVINPTKNLVLFTGKVLSPSTSEVFKKTENPNKISPERTPYSFRGNIVNSFSSRKNDSIQNSSDETIREIESSEKIFQEVKHVQRGQPWGPKFRSIKPLISISQAPLPPAKERGDSADFSSKFGNLYAQPPFRNTFASQQTGFFQKETQSNKRRKNLQDFSGTQKRQEPSLDDWRHHVLFFT